jgi:hypothetical protein
MKARKEGARRIVGLAGPILLLSFAACASSQAPPVETAKKAEPAREQRLAWMPLDPFDAPAVAQAVNDQMGRVKLAGTSAGVKAAVSMEVAQLAIECIQPTPSCYTAVARSLGADRIMWAELAPVPPPDEKIKITVVVFEVQGATASRRAKTFDGAEAARAGIGELVAHATDPGSRSQ